MGNLRKLFNSVLKGRLFRSTGIYVGSSFLNALVPFLMMPILTRYLTPADYGIIAMFTVLVSIVGPFTGLSVHGAVYKQYFDLDREEMKVYVANALGILLCSSCIVGVVVFVFSGPISALSAIPPKWLGAVVVVSMMTFLSQMLLSLWQVQVKPFAYGIYQNLRTLTNIGLSLLFVVGFGLSWQGRVLGIFFNAVFFGFIAFYLLNQQGWLRFRHNPGYVKNALCFGVPLVPTALKDSVMEITGKLFITNMVGLGATGLYSVGYQLSMAISLLTSSFNSAYVPWLFGKLKLDDSDVNKNIVRYTYCYFFSVIAIALLWALVATWLLGFFVGSKFIEAKPYIPWLSLGFAFSGMHSMVVNYIYFSQKTARYGLVSVTSVGVNIGLNYLMISLNGAIGAAQATCITLLLTFLMTWRLSAKVCPMPWFEFMKKEAKV